MMIRSSARLGYLNNELPRFFHLQKRSFITLSRAFAFNVIHRPTSTSTTRLESSASTLSTLPAQKRSFAFSSQLQSQSSESNSAGMSSKLIPSDPDHVMVIRNVTPNIATFSVPFSRFGKVKIGGRGTLGTDSHLNSRWKNGTSN